MNTNRIKLSTILVATFLCNLFSYSQLSVPFKMRYQSFVKGDMTVIANNITNRVDYENQSNVPYYNHTSSAKLNDEYTMEYIDIDDDQSTFSSSSAELAFDNNKNKKIVYAGLYWSATYKYNSAYQKKIGKFVADNPTRDSFDRVQVKFPNSENYTTIKGETIFDGVNQKEFKEFAPYAVYADITSYVKELSNATGVYTVADIKATQGMLSGGVAAGWTIFFVYEDQEMSGKFITSFDGFAGVTDKSTEILFNGFETLPQGSVKAKIACAALEGDNNMIGDQLLFNTTGNIKDFVALSNPLRKTGNFFNSSITIENKYFTNRFPDSKNTLGYDTCLITIPNPNNSVIGNNTKEATLKLKSSGDRYLMFFTAFNVEVTEPNASPIIVNENSIVSNIKNVKPKKSIVKNALIKEIPEGREMIADVEQGFSVKNLAQKKQALSEVDKNNKKEEQIEIRTITISNQESGYYIVANVFSKPENADKFIKLLDSKGIEAKSFVNKINNYRYVYLTKTTKELEAINLYLSKVNDTYQDKIWILSVNNVNLSKAITNNDY